MEEAVWVLREVEMTWWYIIKVSFSNLVDGLTDEGNLNNDGQA